MKSRFAFIAFCLLAVSLALPSAAYAHRPVWCDPCEALEIENLSTSFAFYRTLNAGEVHVYTFQGKTGQSLHAGIEIPVIKDLEGYGVSMALFGPGLPEAAHDQLPKDHPEDLGALVFPTAVSPDFFEPFTQTNYWGRQKANLTLPADGKYYLLIWNAENKPGKYVMDSGRAEVFTPADIFRFPVWWLRVQLFFEHGPQLILVATLIAAVVAGMFIYRKRKVQKV